MDKKFILKVIACILFSLIGSYVIYHLPKSVNLDIKKIDLDKYKKVMFVAHPDDEMIWGGSHLIQDDYLVVCITCGTNEVRLNEFKKVMKETGDSYIALGYPDKTNGKRNEWIEVYDDIKKDIEFILNSNDWELIVTHNEDGEYGHIHHIKTNKIVTELFDANNYTATLFYFGDYYSKKNIEFVENELIAISDKDLERKEKILKIYKSQEKVVNDLSHMNKYEMWEEYSGD